MRCLAQLSIGCVLVLVTLAGVVQAGRNYVATYYNSPDSHVGPAIAVVCTVITLDWSTAVNMFQGLDITNMENAIAYAVMDKTINLIGDGLGWSTFDYLNSMAYYGINTNELGSQVFTAVVKSYFNPVVPSSLYEAATDVANGWGMGNRIIQNLLVTNGNIANIIMRDGVSNETIRAEELGINMPYDVALNVTIYGGVDVNDALTYTLNHTLDVAGTEALQLVSNDNVKRSGAGCWNTSPDMYWAMQWHSGASPTSQNTDQCNGYL